MANAFAIEIDSNKSISYLKEIIKESQKPFFDNVPTKDIKLWKVEICDDDDELSNISLQDRDELFGSRSINDYWTRMPPKRHIHVIISSLTSNINPSTRYFEIFPHDMWSLEYFVICSIYSNDTADKNNIHRIFYKTLQETSDNPKDSQEVREHAKNLLQRKKVS